MKKLNLKISVASKPTNTMIVYGRELEIKKEGARAGFIPFTIKNGSLYFLLGIDRRTRELTDFGGGVKASETLLRGGCREWSEESCKMFDEEVDDNKLLNSVAVVKRDWRAAIVFYHVNPSWLDNAEAVFKQNQADLSGIRKHQELIGVKWVSKDQFANIMFDRRYHCVWRRIQNIIRWSTTPKELFLTLVLGPKIVHAVDSTMDVFNPPNIWEQGQPVF